MPRYKLTIEYDGTGFVGWQRQENGMSVQQAIEEAIAAFAGEAPVIKGAGRTDAGVHATGQVAHVDLAREWDGDKVREATNALLRPHAVSILAAERVADDFDARFSAVKRHYLYRIIDRRAPLALERHHAWHVRHRLDADAMHDAAQGFLGKHDFTTFRASQCQAKSPVKTLDAFCVRRDGDVINLTCSARSFLHNQVRSMVGTLKLVGEGKWSAADLVSALDAADRARCGPVCPPDGLYLTQVDY
ncbi:tRNA pseudouridine38-40 synthase [Breoghania corrubedonensis]|uniref:tRNA pseudouridine synthase A n=1 Tax=Breoghania corrubedonensis TaxID=665038 RepID=A0A2T5VFZ1_9HYPH|nr:tRNA pseudouridine(38-40) synthase TruA [Breoghania corrubedonensis]PTW62674.1 tRNA pseudouridine38-40 synthase [Breoghania corrubedonensis]